MLVSRSYGKDPDLGAKVGGAYRNGATIKQIMEQFGLTKGQASGRALRNVDPSDRRPQGENRVDPNSAAQTKPWEKEGIGRTQWFLKRSGKYHHLPTGGGPRPKGLSEP